MYKAVRADQIQAGDVVAGLGPVSRITQCDNISIRFGRIVEIRYEYNSGAIYSMSSAALLMVADPELTEEGRDHLRCLADRALSSDFDSQDYDDAYDAFCGEAEIYLTDAQIKEAWHKADPIEGIDNMVRLLNL